MGSIDERKDGHLGWTETTDGKELRKERMERTKRTDGKYRRRRGWTERMDGKDGRNYGKDEQK